MKNLSWAIIACTLALTVSCSSGSKKIKDAAYGEVRNDTSSTRITALSHEEALIRSKQISHLTYNLWFGLDDEHEDYEGRAVIHFEVRHHGKELSKTLLIDFEEGTVHAITLNGQALENRFDGHHITLKSNELKAGDNRVEISFTHPFSKNGSGLHRFKDPVDGLVYLYSDFEPYDAHRMFPCFDQPDLKASYELTVEVPPEWLVISNTTERDVTTVDGRKSWQFPPSPLLSTYIVALHAGPYKSWKGDANGISMRLFSRQSVAQWVDHAEWLDVTKRGLDYYSIQFGYPYPYSKYDQIIVPDFNAGAMENAGAVTFSERYIFRSKVTQDKHRGRASTILHEMAHMWFGDLVTMKWWNGLWLNESFATYMATRAIDEATDFKGSWQNFFAAEKQWAYFEDQLVTTHPIEVPVPDTDQAFANFDGITYGKGASVLKQLNYVLGEDDFREGLQRYFQKFALRNTTIHDFIRMLGEASNQDLNSWQKSWLQTTGVNTVRTEWSCTADGKLEKLELVQDAPLRSHKTEIALYHNKKGKLQTDKTIAVEYASARTSVSEAVGTACPDLIYPNHQDFDYIKVELDPTSIKTLTASLGHVDDPFARQLFWNDLWEMVRDRKLTVQEYATIALSQGARETDTQVLSRLLRTLASTDLSRNTVLKYLEGPQRDEWQAKIEKFSHDHLLAAPHGSDQQLIWFKFFLDTVKSEASLRTVMRLLNGQGKLAGLKIDQERRWDLIQCLARNGAPEAQNLIAAELKTDPTDMGLKSSITADVMIPDVAHKKEWLDKILNQSMPYPKLRGAMSAFHIMGQESLSRAAVEPYLAMLPKLSTLQDEQFVGHFASGLFPSLCEIETNKKIADTLKANPNLPAAVVKALRISLQEDERCVLVRKASQK